ncbi:phospholipase [Pseudomonas sp. N40(2020)]|uniref:phosphatidylinositol-specific phospholipase C domain-containing protein n=1 Tax=Pseudomonas sp. N40(2020) TaxID=2767798 RepID=UPI001656CF4E|nr:phosphatidylinositol-specific phospholipase C domain-containing protein [Pseudomonas sp. N40(2020)]MBC8997578.1 phospholipase [Pseudomonas sp. N40(2020)]
MNNTQYETSPLHRWMTATPQINNLSLLELTLPGTHNAGCDKKASYVFPVANWTVCQDDSFYSQLKLGSRALDVRLEYHDKAKGFNQFRFQHNGFLSSRTLEDLLRDLNKFLEENPDEFIILDFHELKKGDSEFNQIKFRDLMLQHLGQRMIPARNVHLTLGELKQASPLQRIVVSASMRTDVLDYRIHSPIRHKWIGETLVSTSDLHKYIKSVVSEPVSKSQLWSLSATTYTRGGPQRILNDLDNWFSPAKSDWAQKCNIINFDFIKDSNIVFYCQSASINKANEKSLIAPRVQAD